MNLCVVSTFDCTVADFKAAFKEYEDKIGKVCSAWEIAEVNEHKAVTMMNVTDKDGFETLMTSPEFIEWNTANNCVDVIYSLEQIG